MADKEKKRYPWNKIKKRSPGPALAVYAGPEYFDKKNKPAAEFEEVYAGPEPPEEITDAAPPETPQFMAVYAGPEYFSDGGPSPQQFMMVYAGPDYFSATDKPPAGAYAPSADSSLETCLKNYCPQCGAEIQLHDRFCRECGYAFERVCSSCGYAYSSASKFCPECGTPAEDK